MKIYAHIADGIVRELISIDDVTLPDDEVFTPVPGKDIFTEEFAAAMVDVTALSPRPSVGWTYDGKAFTAPPAVPPAAPTAYGDDLITALSDAELAAMAGGTLRDQRMLSAQRAPFKPTDDLIARLAAVMKIDPAAWFDRVLGVGA